MASRLEKLQGEVKSLTRVANGYANSEFIADRVLPAIFEDDREIKVPTFGKDARRIADTKRNLRGDSNYATGEDLTFTSVTLQEHDLGFPVDEAEIKAAWFDLLKHYTTQATERLMLGMEKEVADLITDLTAYDSGSKSDLVSADAWDKSDADPVDQIETAKDAIRSNTGRNANKIVLGQDSYKLLRNHSAILDKIKYTQLGVANTDLLAQIFDVDEVIVGAGVYETDGDVTTNVWGDIAWIGYVTPNGTPNKYEPSFGYNFKQRGYPTTKNVLSENGKVIKPLVTTVYQPKIVMSEAGYLINDTNQA